MTTTAAEHSLQRSVSNMARGTGLILFGSVCAQALGLGTHVLVRRLFDVHDFGMLSLALGVVLFTQPLAELGFSGGVTRYVAYYRGRDDGSAVRAIIYTSLLLTTIVGGLLSVGILLGANVIARYMSSPELAPIIRMMAFVTLGLALATIFVGILRGYHQIRQKLILDDFFPNVLKIVLVILVGVLHGPLLWIAGAYLIAAIAEVGVMFWYLRRAILRHLPRGSVKWEAGKELIRFSFPLLGSTNLSAATRQANLFLLGFFVSPTDAGLYSTATLIAPGIQLFYSAMRFIFLPISSELVGAGKFNEFNALYATVSKWSVAITAPVAALVVLIPGSLLVFLFGEQYRPAATAVQILGAGYFFNVWLGPNASALTSLGHSGTVFKGFILSSILAIGASIALVPLFGVVGASIAGSVSIVVSNAYMSIALYRQSTNASLLTRPHNHHARNARGDCGRTAVERTTGSVSSLDSCACAWNAACRGVIHKRMVHRWYRYNRPAIVDPSSRLDTYEDRSIGISSKIRNVVHIVTRWIPGGLVPTYVPEMRTPDA